MATFWPRLREEKFRAARYFIFGVGEKRGMCFLEETASADCPEGWEDDQYFFYEVQGDVAPSPRDAGKVGSEGGEQF